MYMYLYSTSVYIPHTQLSTLPPSSPFGGWIDLPPVSLTAPLPLSISRLHHPLLLFLRLLPKPSDHPVQLVAEPLLLWLVTEPNTRDAMLRTQKTFVTTL